MKDPELQIHINALALAVEKELEIETNVHRNCRLQNVKELLRRAFHQADGSPCEDNDLIPS